MYTLYSVHVCTVGTQAYSVRRFHNLIRSAADTSVDHACLIAVLNWVSSPGADRDTPTSNGSEVTELPAVTVKPEELKNETKGDEKVDKDEADGGTTEKTSDGEVKESAEGVKSEDGVEEVKLKEKAKRTSSAGTVYIHGILLTRTVLPFPSFVHVCSVIH